MTRLDEISIRGSAVAGQFFPAEPARLARMVSECLAGHEAGPTQPRAVISPHAGYVFSGRLAGAAWVATGAARVTRVVVLAPSHQHFFHGIALPSQDRFAMPGFEVEIDGIARKMLLERGLAHVEDAAHDREHAIETQLPFLHALHPHARLVPLVIGQASKRAVARVIDALAGIDKEPPLFVLSSDLSHFLTEDAARARDAATARLIETGAHEEITGSDACGAAAIRGFMASEHGRGLRVKRLAMATSADVTGDTTSTVGYGAWAFHSPADAILSEEHRAMLLQAGREALRTCLAQRRPPTVETGRFPHPLRGHAASFVTVQKNGALRGCICSIQPRAPLVADVVENSIKAALGDPRFAPLTAEELSQVRLKIAVLSPLLPMPVSNETELISRLVPGRDGLVLCEGNRRGVFLPMVWGTLPEPRDFLAALRQKAGLPRDYWSDTLRIERFCAESFGEAA